MTKLLALSATFMAAATWIALLIWQWLISQELWQHDDPTIEDVAGIAVSIVGLVVTVTMAWRIFGKSAGGALTWSGMSLGVALFFLLVTSVGGGYN